MHTEDRSDLNAETTKARISEPHTGQALPTLDLVAFQQRQQQTGQYIAQILDNMSDCFFHLDSQWRYTYINTKTENFSGRTREELLGRCVWDEYPRMRNSVLEQRYREAVAAQQPIHFETDGLYSGKYYEIHVYPMREYGISVYYHDITEQKRAKELAARERKHLELLLNSNIIGLFIADDTYILHSNTALLELFGYTEAEPPLQPLAWAEITPPEYAALDQAMLHEMLEHISCAPYEKEYIRKDGSRIPVLLGAVLYQREPCQWIGFVIDNSERKELERRKDDFISMASHELRNPITAIYGNLQLAERRFKRLLEERDNLPTDLHSVIDDVHTHVGRSLGKLKQLNRLVGDLLDTTRIQANKLVLNPDTCDLLAIVHDTVLDQRRSFPGHKFLLKIPMDLGDMRIHADKDRIEQVLYNLLNNAIKYADPVEPISIGIEQQASQARVWVEDHGPGLSQEQKASIWKRYYQIERNDHHQPTTTEQHVGGGLGLGLYISQTIIGLHNGLIGVESEPGQGSTFWFSLPLLTQQ
ncbi:PAS domain-containing sensor histidine kinase [Ktedonobacter robiniae]|uniref:histidine kinase n=1 Tax=Ktedonobacter robiniae TaxID=2778365 RepID=A0ABQ3ULE8_9CHLR|nr:PAS domain-containing sensor histidine kinase [Ktedonobacter robiniae]GHO53561.1 PAS domain-containing sensor histidine kinase [Ktedonobacter robiniae]